MNDMDVAHEDWQIHGDGCGCREWFHYVATFFVNGTPLTFMLGFPRAREEMGALGWISFDGKQYSLAGNTAMNKDGCYELKTHADFNLFSPGYMITYPKKEREDTRKDSIIYSGTVHGHFPDYQIEVNTPELHINIALSINSRDSVFTRDLSPWIKGGWFHSGDVTASLEGTIAGKKVVSHTDMGWYERNWSKFPVIVPCEWFWLNTRLDKGGEFNLLVEKALDIRIPLLDECWLFYGGTFHEISDYQYNFSDPLKRALRNKNHTKIKDGKITCKGKNKNPFNMTAFITDFRQYTFKNSDESSFRARVTWTNFSVRTEGSTEMDGTTVDMNGQGFAERALIWYWV
jgi:hypothetical protein